MADKKISQLVSALTKNGTDLLVIVQGGVTKKITVTDFVTGLISGANNLSDLADPSASLNNLGGLTATQINTLITDAIEDLEDEKIFTNADSSVLTMGSRPIKATKRHDIVVLSGWANRIATITPSTVLFNLPLGFRPSGNFIGFQMPILSNAGNTQHLNIWLQANGDVVHTGVPGDYTDNILFFDGITFEAVS